jgi:geranylgeranyl reductase family protein
MKNQRNLNPRSGGERPAGPYDAIVVGAGPAGATAAYYLAKESPSHGARRVALLEKATFPRDKFCGDAWCAPALDILEEMGVLQQLEAEGLVQDCTSGGFISPSGESYVSTGEGERSPGPRCYAIKRIICDERIAKRAAEVGAELFEGAAVAEARLEDDGLWTVRCDDGRSFRGRMLVAADGAASRLARSLGVVTTPPEGVAGRQYVKGGTHNFKSGGVLFYPSYILPGYVALFRHYDDDIDVGSYVIPGGAATPEELMELYENEIRRDPFLQRALGPNVEYRERVRVASLRTGGVPRSTARQFMAVGDAAGQTDPLTGEGIHTGMIGGQLAARTIHEVFASGDFSEQACAVYHERWMAAFGRDFPASSAGGRMSYRFPFFLDAANAVAQRKGDAFMADFGAVMTSVKPKTTFLRPGVAIPLGLEVLRQLFLQKILRRHPSIEAAYAARAAERSERPTAFPNSCLLDADVDISHLQQPSRAGSALDAVFRCAGSDPTARRIVVLYGSEYGFAREVAALVCDALAATKVVGTDTPLSPRCVSMADCEIVDWEETATCLLVCSTAGDGVPPVAAKPFFERLAEPDLDLSGVRYAALALGDRAYPNFCRAGRTLDDRMRDRGARALLPRVDVDKEDMSAVQGWLDDVCRTLAAAPTWDGRPAESPSDGLRLRARQHFAQRSREAGVPTKEAPFAARVLHKRDLAKIVDPSDPQTVHIELSAGEDEATPLAWQPGDALGILPSNCPDEVDAVLAELACAGDEPVDLPRGRGRRLLRDALVQDLDIKRVRPTALQALVDRCVEPAERERAARLGDRAAYCGERELLDLLRDFPSAARRLTPRDIVSLLGVIQPRYYSIASSPAAAPDRICLTVSVVRYEALGRTRTGLATTYLADRANAGDRVPVFVQANPEFRLPPEGAGRSCVMIGAGCGAAPYRGFLEELDERARRSGQSLLEASGGEPHLLFFGCRHENRDFLYADEWRAHQSEGGLRVFTAFSRDQREKVYVQDRVREQGELLWRRMESGDHFYVCGDAARMAPDVERALLEIVQSCGGMGTEAAAAYLDAMRAESRLQKDVWVV